MSIEAMNWALNLAPVPWDQSKRGSKPNPACAAVLIGLANHAGPDGRNAFPGVPRLMRYTRLSERTVRTAIDRLAEAKTILPGDPDIVAAHIKRGDRQTECWDLDLSLIRDDLTESDLADLERQFPGLRQRIANEVQPLHPANEVQSLHPEAPSDTNGVHSPHPASSNGVQPSPNGVQLSQERGAVIAPKPSVEPYVEPTPSLRDGVSARDAHTRDAHAREEPPPASTAESHTRQTKIESDTASTCGNVKDPQVKRPRAHSLPAEFEVLPEMLSWAAETVPGVDLEWETEKFRDYWRSLPGARGRKLDWGLTWKNWMRKAYESLPASQRRSPASPEMQEQAKVTANEWFAEFGKRGPIVGRSEQELIPLLITAYQAGITDAHARHALVECDDPVPDLRKFQRVLRTGSARTNGKPASTTDSRVAQAAAAGARVKAQMAAKRAAAAGGLPRQLGEAL